MITGGFTTVPSSDMHFPSQPSGTYEVVEFKYCEFCAHKFLRAHAELRRLKDGSVIDPNVLCPSCEHKLATQAATEMAEIKEIRDSDHLPIERTDRILSINSREERLKALLLQRLHRECFRKESFVNVTLATKVSKRVRSRHEKRLTVFKCKVKFDSTLVPDEWKDRALPHWHIGGSREAFGKK